MSNFKHFKFWCQKVLPLVYDDSLSYYEVLCKVTDKLNELINNYSVVGPTISGLEEAINEVKEWENSFITSNPLYYNENNENAKSLFIDTLGYNFNTPNVEKYSTIKGRNIHDDNVNNGVLKVMTLNAPIHEYNINGTFLDSSVTDFYQLLASEGCNLYGLQEYTNYIDIYSDSSSTHYINTPLPFPTGLINNTYIPATHGLFGGKQYLNVNIAIMSDKGGAFSYTPYSRSSSGYEQGYMHLYYNYNDTVSFYNTHLAPFAGTDYSINTSQLTELANAIKEDSSSIIIVTGDFNLEQDKVDFATFFKPLTDTGLIPVNNSVNTWPRNNSYDMTDNIFFKGCTPINVNYIKEMPNTLSAFDHVGITTEFKM